MIKRREITSLCKCGCGQKVKPGNKYINHHNRINSGKLKAPPKLCACGCGEYAKAGKKFIKWHYFKTEEEKEELKKLHNCACGCGELIKINRTFVSGHNARIYHPTLGKGKLKLAQLCECGCGQMTNIGRKYIFGHHMRGENNPVKRENVRNKTSKTLQGHSVSLETRKKISNSLIGRFSGDKCNFWQGGKSFEEYPQEFNNYLREQIRERDGYICQVCFTSQEKLKNKLSIHHIDYNKKNCSPNNLISLCTNCHVKTNKDREKWQSVFASQ